MKTVLPLHKLDLDTLRQRGLVICDAEGNEGLLMSVQCLRTLPEEVSRVEWREALESWCEEMARILSQHGARLLPDTLSISAQTVEAFVPINRLEETVQCEEMNAVRLDVIVSHRVTL